MAEINGKSEVYGIVGNPVGHSLSPLMHNAAFAALSENRVYVAFQVDDIVDAVKGIRALNIRGVSVTIPHKESIIPCLDAVDPVALKIGAVNTVNVVGQGEAKLLCGSNTDWVGANRALSNHIELQGRHVMLLGAGGSARALAFGLMEAGARVSICSRTEARGRKLAADLRCPWHSLTDIEQLAGDVLVNATSVGMGPKSDESLLPSGHLKNFAVVMDIVYSPFETRLLRDAREAGCKVVYGLEMLLYQGVAQFELWTGQAAPVELMQKVLWRATGNSAQ
ncbi:shikimate dehydrogenase [Desulfoprunum benzoelyticum]|uniref:Shikimate dehydrogenase (NADP(+)) n=1 Tax=Desulfoprunum benzoelyticum TaxID=1506996 RepID=A0A840USJ8_9BACT|nr:shikimate dehydrogenase [Desulfoprunum benzoelyticum]MBB5349187.1 shikimate dehydrogenase [Desulfoprunum benzoelyticum]MBM9530577.1 shikimate dehydrogenase [Desulfoprunum benzoelyticum]